MGLEARKQRTMNLFDDRHWELFIEFTELEMASGGPDPHVAFTGALSKDCDLAEKLWRGGCYIGGYNVASAEIIWRDWPWPRVLKEDMTPWFYEHWKGITTRTERKGVRIKENMVTYFQTYANWMKNVLEGKKYYINDKTLSPVKRYELMWEDTNTNIKYFGRYVAIKLLEYCKRYCGFDIEMPDVRPLDGWSPRTTLSLLYPDKIDYFLSDNSEDNMNAIQEHSEDALQRLRDSGLPEADMFTLEVVLCNYRQAYVGRKLYPGRTHDTEKGYYDKIIHHWNDYEREPLKFFEVRKQIFPHEHLSEFHGDWGVRSKQIGSLIREGIIWSDLLFDYNATLKSGDFSHPVQQRNYARRYSQAFRLREKAMN